MQAILIITAWDFRAAEQFPKVLVRAVAAEPIMIVGLVLALTTLAGG